MIKIAQNKTAKLTFERISFNKGYKHERKQKQNEQNNKHRQKVR